MNPQVELAIGVFVLSLALTYAWWVKIRVWMLRQDLFAIRDDLWDQMRAQGQLDDPSHRKVRHAINHMIRFAPMFSFIPLCRILADGVASPGSCDPVHPAVAEARHKVIMRLIRYLLLETLIGLVITTVAMIYASRQVLNNQLRKWIGRIFDSSTGRPPHNSSIGLTT